MDTNGASDSINIEPQSLAKLDISDPDLSCDYVTNQLITHITKPTSLFYFLVSGWYLGQLGDYASCRTYANNGQYMLATISGEYTADYTFTRGSYGKYFPFSTQVGVCVPKQCTVDEVTQAISPLLIRYAEEAHWQNPTVLFEPSWDYVHTESRTFDSTGKIVGVCIFALLILAVAIGSCVEMTSIGDDPEYDKEIIRELNKFKSTDQYESVIMQRKKPWARKFVAISAIRNINKLNMKPYSMRSALSKSTSKYDATYLQNLSIFNGIKALCCFWIILASTFLYTWYAYWAIPGQVKAYKENFLFVFIYAAYFSVPILFMVAGFLQTFNFMQQSHEEMFKLDNLVRYYAWRLTKFVPLLGAILIFGMFVMPFLGAGPIWNVYAQTMAPCET